MKQIHTLMLDHLQAQKSLWKFKKIAAAFFGIIVILAVSNLATSFAAAYLSKDTMANGGDLKDKGGITLGMQSTAEHSEAIAINIEEDEDTVASFLELDIDQGKMMVMECKADRTVHMSRTFKDGRVTDYAFCPIPQGHKAAYDFRNPDLPSVEISTLDGPVMIAPNEDGSFYTVTGTGVTSHAGFPCDDISDCDPGLVCNSESSCATPVGDVIPAV